MTKEEINNPESEINKTIQHSFDPENVHFGDYAGQTWARVPLHWLNYVREQYHPESIEYRLATKELKRRGKIYNRVTITLHAVDRFSKYVPDWEKLKEDKNEGIVGVLSRIAETIVGYLPEGRSSKHAVGVRLVFLKKEDKIILTTVVK